MCPIVDGAFLDTMLRVYANMTADLHNHASDVQAWHSTLSIKAWEYCWGSTLFHRDDLPFKKARP